jgi:hypothetical protein
LTCKVSNAHAFVMLGSQAISCYSTHIFLQSLVVV